MSSLRSIALRALLPGLCAAALACSSGDDDGTGGWQAGGAGGVGGAGGSGATTTTWQAGPISVVQQSGSSWTVVEVDGEVIAQHLEGGIELLIDPDSAEPDQRYAGIYLYDGGQLRFTGTYYGSECSMFVPDRPHVDQTAVTVTATAELLTVEMTEGSLSEMVDSQFPSDEPFRWRSSWQVDPAGVQLSASGLYYLLVPKQGCEVAVFGEGGAQLGSLQIDDDTLPFLEYFSEVRSIALSSQLLGSLTANTDARVLQVQVPSYPSTSLFELDFDHSFKDHGQSDVPTEMTLPRASR